MRQPAFVGSSITTRGGDAKVHGRMLPVAPIELVELLLSASQADLETFDRAEPAFRLGFGASGDQVVTVSASRARWARYGRVDLLCLDELGYLDPDKTGAKLLFQVFTELEERRAITIASNAPFSERKQTFTDPQLCSAIVDRVTFNAHIIETGTDSFRLAQAQEKRRRKA